MAAPGQGTEAPNDIWSHLLSVQEAERKAKEELVGDGGVNTCLQHSP